MSLLHTDWTTAPLGRLVSINERTLAETTDPDYTFRYLDISSVGRGEITEEPKTMRFENAPSRARRILRTGDTIVSTVRTYLRAVLPVRDDPRDLIASTGFAVLSPGADIDSRFLGWFAQSDTFIEEVVARSVGVSYPAIAPSELAHFPVPTPGLAEQRAIADYLDAETARIDALIEKKRRLNLALEERQTLLIKRELDSAEQILPLRRVVSRVQTGTTPTDRILERPQEFDIEWFTPADLGPGLVVRPSERRLDAKALQECVAPRFPADSALIV
ncbi:MAG: restriction endonuclease subunit S, partial [Actinomycetota bacterium]|nr:restriction endonuclease subunit S [Actinomycetota bacterium]